MNARAIPLTDPVAVRTFVERIHAVASAAFEDVQQPGMLQLVRIFPDGEAVTEQYAIGEVDHMVDEAVRQAGAGHNIYVEGRTVRKRARGERGRGSEADTVGVFALVVDDDADKGAAAHATVAPTLVVESSPGNRHLWFVLDRAVGAVEGKALGQALKAKTGGDADTGVITQPYRVAGTPNLPGKKKLARGRFATQTEIVSLDGPTWSRDAFQAAFPHVERPRAEVGIPTGITDHRSRAAESILAVPEDQVQDRSAEFHSAAWAAFHDGLTADDFEALCRAHPGGSAAKFLAPRDRLRMEIDRSFARIAATEAAREDGEKVDPTYTDWSVPVQQAREAVTAAVSDFTEAAIAWRMAGDEAVDPPVHALNVSTGVGKTRGAAAEIAAFVRARKGAGRSAKPILYAVPTHRLGSEVEALFAEHGITAKVFRGRKSPDPIRLDKTMCDDLEAVEVAHTLGLSAEKYACRLKRGDEVFTCPHFETCGYQAQKGGRPDVWIVAHEMMFMGAKALGEVELVVIDEGFWQSGIRIPKRGLSLDEIRGVIPMGQRRDDCLHNDIEAARAKLGRALTAQLEAHGEGGVRREHLLKVGLTPERCTEAISNEWHLKEEAEIWPGMPRAARRKALEAAHHAKYVNRFVSLWRAARELLNDETIGASGRLYLDHRDDDGEGRVVLAKARSLKAVAAGWCVPTLLMDATLPAPEILKAFYPAVQVPDAIEAAMPYVTVRQVTGAPVAARKLKVDEDGDGNRNLRAIRCTILRRFVELGREPVLVVCQKAVETWLRASGLPEGISVEHFNNVAGLDGYRDVRGIILVGRTQPGPAAVEALAGAITGREPERGERYQRVVRGVRLRDGSAVALDCDAHPDPVAEACRWQICEGELLQALGRARGVNRTAEMPLSVDIIADVCLPMTVDAVERWSVPGEEWEMLAEGVVLDSPADMAAAWPAVWGTPMAAKKWLHRQPAVFRNTGPNPYKVYISIRVWPRVRRFRYQRLGPNQKWRAGACDPAAVPDIRRWLEMRLGPLAGFEILAPADGPDPKPTPNAEAVDQPQGDTLRELTCAPI